MESTAKFATGLPNRNGTAICQLRWTLLKAVPHPTLKRNNPAVCNARMTSRQCIWIGGSACTLMPPLTTSRAKSRTHSISTSPSWGFVVEECISTGKMSLKRDKGVLIANKSFGCKACWVTPHCPLSQSLWQARKPTSEAVFFDVGADPALASACPMFAWPSQVAL